MVPGRAFYMWAEILLLYMHLKVSILSQRKTNFDMCKPLFIVKTSFIFNAGVIILLSIFYHPENHIWGLYPPLTFVVKSVIWKCKSIWLWVFICVFSLSLNSSSSARYSIFESCNLWFYLCQMGNTNNYFNLSWIPTVSMSRWLWWCNYLLHYFISN